MIGEFKGKYRFLSNFHPARIEYEHLVYPSVEHAYVAAKTKNMKFKRLITTIPANQAGKAKRMGSVGGMKKFGCNLIKDWDFLKTKIMLDLLRLKFQDVTLSGLLLQTGDEYLQEGNKWHDNYWGACKCEQCLTNTIGFNMLGQLLMNVRKELQDGKKS